MTAAIPDLNTSEIAAELKAQYGATRFYIERDIEFARLAKRIGDIEQRAPGVGLSLRAQLEAVLGDTQGLEAIYTRFRSTPHGAIDAANIAVAFSRLGQFRVVQDILRTVCLAESGHLSRFRDRAYSAGLFHHVHDQFEKAKQMNLEFTQGGATRSGEEVHRILSKTGISDEALALQMEAFGTVLRKNKRLPQGISSGAAVLDDDFEIVTIRCLINANASELFRLNLELVEAMDELELPTLPNLALTFAGDELLDVCAAEEQ